MKRKECFEEYAVYTGKTSDIVRQLAFAGFALIWLFKSDVAELGPVVPREFAPAATLLLGALVADFLQYGIAAGSWHWFKLKLIRDKTPDEKELEPADWLYRPAEILFYMKAGLLLLAYVLLLSHLLTSRTLFYTPRPKPAGPPQASHMVLPAPAARGVKYPVRAV
jgi:hypothetical protein